MKSPKISIRAHSGFTLIEILVVVGIFVLLAGLGLFVSMDAYRAYAFRERRDELIGQLREARSRAMANVGQTDHSVVVDPTTTITFERLSGNSSDRTITLTDGIRTVDIEINSAGRINWENV